MTALLDGPTLTYPGPRLAAVDGVGNGRGEWDWFYALPTAEQNRLRYYMSGRGSTPDEWAAAMGFDDVELAMVEWRGLVAEYRAETHDEWGERPDEEETEEAPAVVIIRERLLGLSDLADLVGAKRGTAYKWQARGQLPPADLKVSGADAWYLSTVEAWHMSRSAARR